VIRFILLKEADMLLVPVDNVGFVDEDLLLGTKGLDVAHLADEMDAMHREEVFDLGGVT
jgi:hypothetical protein